MKFISKYGPTEIGPGFYNLVREIHKGHPITISCDDGNNFDWRDVYKDRKNENTENNTEEFPKAGNE